jgi:large repetitive protein
MKRAAAGISACVLAGATISFAMMASPAGAAPRTISISNASVKEGDSDTKTAHFEITLSRASSKRVIVSFKTVDRTAKAGKDYEARDGKRIFDPGEKKESIGVRIIGDEIDEFDEIFLVKLSDPVNAELGDRKARGKIVDDDDPPAMSIVDDSTSEGGTAGLAVRLTRRSGKRITVDYATSGGTATENVDYAGEESNLLFHPGDKQVLITIDSYQDDLNEIDEAFDVDLSDARHATITDGHGVGTILDDD